MKRYEYLKITSDHYKWFDNIRGDNILYCKLYEPVSKDNYITVYYKLPNSKTNQKLCAFSVLDITKCKIEIIDIVEYNLSI